MVTFVLIPSLVDPLRLIYCNWSTLMIGVKLTLHSTNSVRFPFKTSSGGHPHWKVQFSCDNHIGHLTWGRRLIFTEFSLAKTNWLQYRIGSIPSCVHDLTEETVNYTQFEMRCSSSRLHHKLFYEDYLSLRRTRPKEILHRRFWSSKGKFLH